MGTKGIPTPFACCFRTGESSAHHIKPSFIPYQRLFSPSSVEICLLHSCPPTNKVIRNPQLLFDIYMIPGFLLVHFFFPRLKHTFNTICALIKLILDFPQLHLRFTIHRLPSKSEMLVFGGLRAFASEMHQKVGVPSDHPSLLPPSQQTRSVDQLRGRKRERQTSRGSLSGVGPEIRQ